MSTGRPRKTAFYQIGPLEWLPRRNFTTFFSTGRTLYCVLSIGSHLGGHFTTFFLLDRWSSGDVIVFYRQQEPQRWYFCCVLFFASNIRLMSPSVGPLPRVVLETCTINTATVSKIIYVRPSSESRGLPYTMAETATKPKLLLKRGLFHASAGQIISSAVIKTLQKFSTVPNSQQPL